MRAYGDVVPSDGVDASLIVSMEPVGVVRQRRVRERESEREKREQKDQEVPTNKQTRTYIHTCIPDISNSVH